MGLQHLVWMIARQDLKTTIYIDWTIDWTNQISSQGPLATSSPAVGEKRLAPLAKRSTCNKSKQRYCVSHRSVYVYTFLALVTHSEVATFQLNDTYMGASAEESGLKKHL